MRGGLFVSNVIAVVILAATVATTLASTPCDELRRKALTLETHDPQATEDTGDGRFLAAILGTQPAKHASGLDGYCDALRTWLKNADLDSKVVDDLEEDPLICATLFTLYDHRKDGGFIALWGTQGSGREPVAAVLDFVKGRLRVGWTWVGGMWPDTFDVVYVHGRPYPAVLTPELYGTDLSYRIDLISVGKPDDGPFCSLSITYKPNFAVAEWFGPKGENDVDRDLRRAVAPIVSALAAGGDARNQIKPWLDHPRGDSVYDHAISGYPDRPIDEEHFPSTSGHVSGIPWGPPFLGGEYDTEYYRTAYGSIQDGPVDPIPLYIKGRRLLLTFGYASSPGLAPPEAGFGLWEYNEQAREFDGVAGGIMLRRGMNPKID